MQSNLQNKTVTQCSFDLRLALLGKDAEAPVFPVFHSRNLDINAWSVLLEIIGESHRIRVQHKASDLWLTEILACLPPGSELRDPIYEGKLSKWKSSEFHRTSRQHRYAFNYNNLNFSDADYESRIRESIKGGTDIITYDFASHRKDGNLDLYGPTTMISVRGDDHSIEWASLHAYPDEQLSILSHSSLAIV